MNYQRVYGSVILDEIHNYFPAFLYEPERFANVPQVMSYISGQVHEHFDLFSMGRRLAQQQQPPQQQRHVPIRMVFEPAQEAPEIASVASQILSEYMNPGADSIFNIINTISRAPAQPRRFMDPIPVRPTVQQIAAATSIELIDAEGDVCAICQDTMAPGREVRNLNACDHRFHTGCIDTWFTTNVHCPVCRHDIRNVATQD